MNFTPSYFLYLVHACNNGRTHLFSMADIIMPGLYASLPYLQMKVNKWPHIMHSPTSSSLHVNIRSRLAAFTIEMALHTITFSFVPAPGCICQVLVSTWTGKGLPLQKTEGISEHCMVEFFQTQHFRASGRAA